MNLELALKYLLRGKDITMTDVINSVGMSQAGFYKMLNSNSVKVNTLEKIASFLKVDVSLFFRDYSSIQSIESMDWPALDKAAKEAREDWPIHEKKEPDVPARKKTKAEEKYSNLLLITNIYNYHLQVFHADIKDLLNTVTPEVSKEEIIKLLKEKSDSIDKDWKDVLDVINKL